jgi:hypothetical protein
MWSFDAGRTDPPTRIGEILRSTSFELVDGSADGCDRGVDPRRRERTIA